MVRPDVVVIGFGGSAHDWSTCIVDKDGVRLFLEEERIIRSKYGLGSNLLHSRSRDLCLQRAGLRPEQISTAVACDLVPLPLAAPFRRRLTRVRHHLAHAYGAFFSSGFTEAAVLVVDNGGSGGGSRREALGSTRSVETTTGWIGRGRNIEPLMEICGNHPVLVGRAQEHYHHILTDDSLGSFYNMASNVLGHVYPKSGSIELRLSEDGKTMGLAAYGDSRYVESVAQFITLEADGRYRLNLTDGRLFQLMLRWLSESRQGSDQLLRASLAYAVQYHLERILLHVARHLRKVSGQRNLAIAGGVALNCVANTRIAEAAGFDSVFVLPAAGDAGNALGSALYGLVVVNGEAPPKNLPNQLPFLGPKYTVAEIEDALRAALECGLIPVDCGDLSLTDYIANALASGSTIGWFQGRSEIGPRALGARSIIGDPRDPKMRTRLNRVTKRRESYRPFAPMVLEQYAHEIFDITPASLPCTPFMLSTAHVREEWRHRIPSVTHVDGSARLQIINDGSGLHDIVSAFSQRTGVPVILNTSFNRGGEPIVESPLDALRCFVETDLDLLYLEGRLLARSA